MPTTLLRAHGPLGGEPVVPGDKSVCHRTALLPLLAEGPCTARGWSGCADTLASLAAVRALGARAELDGDTLCVDPGAAPADRLRGGETPVAIDCGNSGTTARLLLGLLAGWLPHAGPGVVLDGDASLRRRPMARVVDPLRTMGADITWLGDEDRLPVWVRGARLVGRDHRLPLASAQLKSALLLAGVTAAGETMVSGGGGSRDHTERLLRAMGAPLTAGAGDELALRGGGGLDGFDVTVPGDPSAASFLLTAAALVPGSRVTVRGLGLAPGRTAFLDVLRRAGAEVTVDPAGPADPAREPRGDVTVAAARRRGFRIEADEVPGLVDELPVLAVFGAVAEGTTVIAGAGDLRHKESDRLDLMARGLGALGARVTARDDGLIIQGGELRGGPEGGALVLATGGDHRIAMALAVAALAAKGETALDDGACVAVSFPEFFPTLARTVGVDR